MTLVEDTVLDPWLATWLDTLPDDPALLQQLIAEADATVIADREERKQYAEANPLYFFRYYLSEFGENASPAFHQELFEAARQMELPRSVRGIIGTIIGAPRGHAKSTIVTLAIPLYNIVFKKKRFIVIVSDTGFASEGFVLDIKKQLEENERLREDFGELCGDTMPGRPYRWTNSDFTAVHRQVVRKNGVERLQPTFTTRVLARSTGAQFRGLRSGSWRPDLILCDDLENDEHVRTPEQRAKIWEWFVKAVLPAMDPERGGIVVVGTVLHFDSLLSRLLNLAKREPTLYGRLFFQAIQADGSVLWPQRFSRELLDQRKKVMGTLAFNCEYLLIPIDEETRLYRPHWVKWYTGNELEHDGTKWKWRGETLDIYVGVDPAISEDEQADFFSYVVLGVARKAKALVILYAYADRIDFPAQVQEIIRVEATWQPRFIGIERNAYQRALPQQLIKESMSLGQRIKQLDNRGQKYTRILAASVPFENGTVYLRAATEGESGELDETGQVRVYHTLQGLYQQMMQYPNSANDDILDAMENSFQLGRSKTKAFAGWGEEEQSS